MSRSAKVAGGRVLAVDTDANPLGCPRSGALTVAHGRRNNARRRRRTVLRRPDDRGWRNRIWRRPDRICPGGTFSEVHNLVPPRGAQGPGGALGDRLADDDTVSALAGHLGVQRHTL